jgi:hypothetical protein
MTTPPFVARAGADAELLELGRQFEAAWAEYEAVGARYDVAVEPVDKAVEAQGDLARRSGRMVP